ncbi:MAG TPA: 2Fe-2S iron-sulfur cluster-binding protein [Steroidobacteraceae bacterium]|jgi:2Fe-2S ferredoxin|nr:2Fe-2S iron-sulfur cluster-binding protein [Steroidobacteraceae bacterium]
MPQLIVTDRGGTEHVIEVNGSGSMMEVIRDHGISDLTALCGGCCACATCHVYIDETSADKLPAISDDENALLDGSMHRNSTSRLSCQLSMAQVPDGMRVVVAPED